MRILHITNHLNAGGVERLLSDLLPIFNQKNNIQVDLMLLESKQEDLFLKKLKNKNIGIFYSTVSKRLSIKKIIEIRNIARKYDVIHTHLFPSQY